ncbi:hypothetical protein [Evansella cellulosilytica]|uniref:Uncharacterized protein n=1 Tax=Evansella cellulosilytica (strain ATCC 21833 / DSM 2522 / FERM P-1141 / JCM 9156 / N-4) TaxID=649639 RepID=E6TQP3_EVAC2|nr:hypothetical protein [Evansella cellulosilytica]ADU30554.1 hypothetical protein Bcell_2294 [Evansella cellulosilytica DSM 2522]
MDTKLIEQFTDVMILKERIGADRTWFYTVKRFLNFANVKAKEPFNEKHITEYKSYLKNNKKTTAQIEHDIKVIILFAKYNHIKIDENAVTNVDVVAEDLLIVERESDIFHTEKELFNQILTDQKGINLRAEPTIKDLPLSSYTNLRNSMQNYLLFRLVIEKGFDSADLKAMNISTFDEKSDEEEYKMTITFSANTMRLVKEYIDFRKLFDRITFIQKAIVELFPGEKFEDFIRQKNLTSFYEASLEEKIHSIENLVEEQMRLEDLLMTIDGENDNEEQLEKQTEDIAESIENRKKLVILDRKINEFTFNDALFVNENYLRMTEREIVDSLERHSFPLHKLQNSAVQKWEQAGIKVDVIKKVLGIKAGKEKVNENKIKQMIENGYQFPGKSFYETNK